MAVQSAGEQQVPEGIPERTSLRRTGALRESGISSDEFLFRYPTSPTHSLPRDAEESSIHEQPLLGRNEVEDSSEGHRRGRREVALPKGWKKWTHLQWKNATVEQLRSAAAQVGLWTCPWVSGSRAAAYYGPVEHEMVIDEFNDVVYEAFLEDYKIHVVRKTEGEVTDVVGIELSIDPFYETLEGVKCCRMHIVGTGAKLEALF